MKKCVLITMLAAMVVSGSVLAQEHESQKGQRKRNVEQQIQIRSKQLQSEEREAQARFRRKMRELELEERSIEIEQQRNPQEQKGHSKGHKCVKMLLLICFIVHILLAVWVYKDIRQRNAGSGLWIVVVLLTGLLGTLVYAVVRLGDIRGKAG